MKLSELTAADVAKWLGYITDGDTLADAESAEFNTALSAAVRRALSYTGLTSEEADEHEDIAIAVLGICNDFLTNNRPESADSGMNKMSESILATYSKNLL